MRTRPAIMALLAALSLAHALDGQTPLKLAIIPANAEAAAAIDLLTAAFSKQTNVQLLERAEIDKALREQALGAATANGIKTGRVLGADGALVVGAATAQGPAGALMAFGPPKLNLSARLIAVKPGVVLSSEQFPSVSDVSEWAESLATRLEPSLDKLGVAASDAIPISIVNLRESIQTREARETERAIQLLAINRLSQEPRIFVLERQRMASLAEEKTLQADESAFWNGRYLLEGVIDQQGFARDKITIDARLTARGAGAPLTFQVAGPRTNYAEVINALAEKVTALLKVKAEAKPWSAGSEAEAFFEEAKWALRWRALPEAEASADSAWALGKADLACALVRIGARAQDVATNNRGFQEGGIFYGSEDAFLRSEMRRVAASNVGAAFLPCLESGNHLMNYEALSQMPDRENLERAIGTLELYDQFCRSSPDGVPTVKNDYPSDWYKLGIGALTACSELLAEYHIARQAQTPVADKLAELRALARSVSQFVAASPTVHDSYFVGTRAATHDELDRALMENPNIFRCELNFGCLWQERPEDTIDLYRSLLSSTAFRYIQANLWRRKPSLPRLAAWNDDARRNLPLVWDSFKRELVSSTNLLWRLQALSIETAEATNNAQQASLFTNLCQTLLGNREAFVTNNVDLMYLDWDLGLLVNPLSEAFWRECRGQFAGMEQEYWAETVPNIKSAGDLERKNAEFERQKDYLARLTPYEFMAFAQLFGPAQWTRAQAVELKPLASAYKSNLLAHAEPNDPLHKTEMAVFVVQNMVERRLDDALKPAPPPRPLAPVTNRIAMSKPRPRTPAPLEKINTATPKLEAGIFFQLPTNHLRYATNVPLQVEVTGERWVDGQLLTEVMNSDVAYSFDAQGNWQGTRNIKRGTLAVFDAASKAWRMIDLPESAGNPLRFVRNSSLCYTLCNGELFTLQDGVISKYAPGDRAWRPLPIPAQDAAALYAVGGRLFATGADNIIEIVNESATRVLASVRRRPAASALDGLETLGSPPLFAAANHELCAVVQGKTCEWDGQDWRELFTIANSRPQGICVEGVFYRSVFDPIYHTPSLWLWDKASAGPQLCVNDISRPLRNIIYNAPPKTNDAGGPPLWHALKDEILPDAAVTRFKSRIYFVTAERSALAQNGQAKASLVCLETGIPEPLAISLTFDESKGPGISGAGSGLEWMQNGPLFGGQLALFFTDDMLFLTQPKICGVWAIPVSGIDAAVAQARQGFAARRQTDESSRQSLLAKYDHNHNGVLDPDEREEAMADPTFIASELSLIDANSNGLLDRDELAYFDANHNGALDTNEEIGLESALRLLAAKAVAKYDVNNAGGLNFEEFNNFQLGNRQRRGPGAFQMMTPFPDANHDGLVDADELAVFMRQDLMRNLAPPRPPGPAFRQAAMPRESLKFRVERYWRDPALVTNAPRDLRSEMTPRPAPASPTNAP